MRPALRLRSPCQHRIAAPQKVLEAFTDTGMRESAEDHPAAGRELDRRETRTKLLGEYVVEFAAVRNADRTTLPVIGPMMEAADDGTIAAIGVAKRHEAMRADILETAQFRAETLDEHRAGRDRRPEPIAILPGVARHAQKGPDGGQPPLLLGKCRRVYDRPRPVIRNSAAVLARVFLFHAATG